MNAATPASRTRDRAATPAVERAPHRARALVMLSLAAALLAACGQENQYAPPPPPEVSVAQPIEKEVTTYSEFTGYTAAVETLDIRARVQGYLKSVNFVPGGVVKQGQLLFVIEPELYETQVAQAEADLAGKEAQSRAAEEQLSMTQAMFARAAGSRSDLVQKQQQRDQAKTLVDIAKANLAQARLNLSYTHLYAPFDGRIDRNQVDVGNLVGVGQATVLATMIRSDPIYAYFNSSERDVLLHRGLRRQNRGAVDEGEPTVAYLGLATEDGYPHVGTVDYVSNRVDSSTGTVEIRAVFPNPEWMLIPGLFARVRVPLTRARELLIPDVAIGADQGGRFVLVVDEKNVVQQRRIQIATMAEGGMRIVSSGLSTADWVVVNGLQRAHPGAVVNPLRTASPALAATPGETGTSE